MSPITAEAEGECFDPVKQVSDPSNLLLSFQGDTSAVVPQSVTRCYVRVYMLSSNMSASKQLFILLPVLF